MLYSQTINFPNWGISLWALKSSRHPFWVIKKFFLFSMKSSWLPALWRFFSALLSMPLSFDGDYRTLWSIRTGFLSALLPWAPASLHQTTALLLGKSHMWLREKLLISFSALISAFCVPHPHTWWRPAGKIERMVQAFSVAEKPWHSEQSCQPTCSHSKLGKRWASFIFPCQRQILPLPTTLPGMKAALGFFFPKRAWHLLKFNLFIFFVSLARSLVGKHL